MKALRVPVENIREGEQELDRDSSHYVLVVHRSRPGMPLVLFDAARGTEADATLVSTRARSAVCQVGAQRRAENVPTRAITLIQCLAKGDKMDRVIRDATALGATRIIAAIASRSVSRVEREDSDAKRQRWSRIAVEAARQAQRGNVPELVGPLTLDAAASRAADCALRLMLAPGATARLQAYLSSHVVAPVVICIGPEGGFDAAEEASLREHGFVPVRFGDYVLRTETAATAVLGALVDWGSD